MTTPAKTGSEFHINITSLNSQDFPAVAVLNNSDFAVTWASWQQDGSGYGIYARRYHADGTPAGGEFQVSTHTANDQNVPFITALNNNGFVITWRSQGQDGSGDGVYAQRFDDAGNPDGSEFRVNTTTAGDQWVQSITTLNNGQFVINWTSVGQDGDGDGVFGQRFTENGTPVGG